MEATTSGKLSKGEAERSRVDLIPAKRRAVILEYLRKEGTADLHELASLIGASSSTIRRDLDTLAGQGALERTHGGAVLRSEALANFEPDPATAAEVARSEKEAIAAATVAELRSGQSVIFDSSTTVLQVARHIAQTPVRITAVTNNLAIGQVLAGIGEVQLIMLGGTCKPGSLTLVGRTAEVQLAQLHADIALLGTHAITGRTLTETSLEVAAMKQAMMRAARRRIVLADSSKFSTPSFCTICDASEIDELVTDDGVDPVHLGPLRELDLKIRVAALS